MNHGLNKLKHGSQNTKTIYKSEISDLFCVCFLVRLRAQFVRYISRIFPNSPNKLEKQGSQNRFFSKKRVNILRVYFGPT